MGRMVGGTHDRHAGLMLCRRDGHVKTYLLVKVYGEIAHSTSEVNRPVLSLRVRVHVSRLAGLKRKGPSVEGRHGTEENKIGGFDAADERCESGGKRMNGNMGRDCTRLRERERDGVKKRGRDWLEDRAVGERCHFKAMETGLHERRQMESRW